MRVQHYRPRGLVRVARFALLAIFVCAACASAGEDSSPNPDPDVEQVYKSIQLVRDLLDKWSQRDPNQENKPGIRELAEDVSFFAGTPESQATGESQDDPLDPNEPAAIIAGYLNDRGGVIEDSEIIRDDQLSVGSRAWVALARTLESQLRRERGDEGREGNREHRRARDGDDDEEDGDDDDDDDDDHNDGDKKEGRNEPGDEEGVRSMGQRLRLHLERRNMQGNPEDASQRRRMIRERAREEIERRREGRRAEDAESREKEEARRDEERRDDRRREAQRREMEERERQHDVAQRERHRAMEAEENQRRIMEEREALRREREELQRQRRELEEQRHREHQNHGPSGGHGPDGQPQHHPGGPQPGPNSQPGPGGPQPGPHSQPGPGGPQGGPSGGGGFGQPGSPGAPFGGGGGVGGFGQQGPQGGAFGGGSGFGQPGSHGGPPGGGRVEGRKQGGRHIGKFEWKFDDSAMVKPDVWKKWFATKGIKIARKNGSHRADKPGSKKRDAGPKLNPKSAQLYAVSRAVEEQANRLEKLALYEYADQLRESANTLRNAARQHRGEGQPDRQPSERRRRGRDRGMGSTQDDAKSQEIGLAEEDLAETAEGLISQIHSLQEEASDESQVDDESQDDLVESSIDATQVLLDESEIDQPVELTSGVEPAETSDVPDMLEPDSIEAEPSAESDADGRIDDFLKRLEKLRAEIREIRSSREETEDQAE